MDGTSATFLILDRIYHGRSVLNPGERVALTEDEAAEPLRVGAAVRLQEATGYESDVRAPAAPPQHKMVDDRRAKRKD